MANQYQNFSNPTITPDQPTGWQAANQSMSGLISHASDYLVQQQQKVQEIQLQQAQDLNKFKTLDQVYYGGAHSQQLDSLLSQNPYGRHIVGSRSSLSNAGQPDSPMTGNPNVGAAMIGAPGASMYGTGMFPMNSPTTGGAPSGGGSMSSVNPASSGPVVIGGTQKAFEPPSMTFANPSGEAQVAAAKTGAEGMTTANTEANIGATKDTQQLGMIVNALKPLAESYEKVYNSKALGMPAAGDVYGSSIVKHLDMIPRGAQSSVVNPDTQAAAGQFLANKNELVTKLQPMLSQQFGKDGSSRIMESLLNMSQNELGDLNTPRDQFHGQLTGTISSLYRIAKAAQAYKQDLQTSGQQPPDPQTATSEIMRRMQLQTMGPQEQKELQGLIRDTLGTKQIDGAKSSLGGSMNPVTQSKSQPKQQNNVASNFTRQEILEELQRRRNLKDIQSNISQ